MSTLANAVPQEKQKELKLALIDLLTNAAFPQGEEAPTPIRPQEVKMNPKLTLERLRRAGASRQKANCFRLSSSMLQSSHRFLTSSLQRMNDVFLIVIQGDPRWASPSISFL